MENQIVGNHCEAICRVDDKIIDSMYIRTCYAPKGTLVVGCGHKKDGISILEKGAIRQIDGDDKYDIVAPCKLFTSAGTQRMAYAIEDTIYTTIHRVESDNCEDAEKELYDAVPQLTRIRNSYKSLLLEYSITEDDVQKEMASKEVVALENDMYEIRESFIQGVGCFTKKNINKGDIIEVSYLDGERRLTARYVNHSDIPNSRHIKCGESGKISLIAIVDIPIGSEILTNYKETIQCQQ
jgi:hypothetical protein